MATVKKEKIYDPTTSSYNEPHESLMVEVEKIIGVSNKVERHRESLLGRIAAWKIENKQGKVDVRVIFHDMLTKIQDHYHTQRKKVIDDNFLTMLTLGTEDEKSLKTEDIEIAETTFSELERRFGYDRESARECVKFLVHHRKKH